MTDPAGRERVLVAIPTRGRRDLGPALDELARQAAASTADVDIAVLDNSGTDMFDADRYADTHGCRVHVVAQPGLAHVRNAAIDLLGSEHRALIFMDDDECPEPTWLAAMLDAHETYEATVVVGPVRVEVPPGSPAWLEGGAFWRTYPARAEGPMDGEAYSGNTLLDARFLRRTALRFDHAYDQTGGEDTDFFRRLRAAGGLVAWSEKAAVTEQLDADRASLAGALRRAFHAANLSWRLDRESLGTTKLMAAFVRRSGRLPRGLGLVAGGAVSARSDRAVRGLCDCAAAAGTWASALGWTSRYYR